MQTNQRNIRLDIIRGIAVLMVFFYHLSLIYFNYNDYLDIKINDSTLHFPSYLLQVISTTVGKGYYGVNLFFILSGYLIHEIYYFQEKTNWFIFFHKRFWRIYPIYFIVLTFWFFMFHKFPAINLKDYIMHVFLVHNFDENVFFSINPSFWSLALEVHFYLLFPIVLYFSKKVSFFTIFICSILLSLLIQNNAFLTSISFLSTFKYLFMWLSGGLIVIYRNSFLFFCSKYKYVLHFIFILLFIVSSTKSITIENNSIHFISEFLFCFVMFLEMLTIKIPFVIRKVVKSKLYVLQFFGLISYNMYLIHQPIIVPLRMYFIKIVGNRYLNFAIEQIFVLFIITLFSYSIYKLIEVRFMKYGNMLLKK